MMNKLFEFPHIFKTIKCGLRKNPFFYTFAFLLLISSFLIFSFENMVVNGLRIDKIASYAYNAIFILMIALYFVRVIITYFRKHDVSPMVFKTTLILILFLFIFLISSIINRNLVKTPYINILLFFAIFSVVALASHEEKQVALYFIFVSLSLYVVIAFFYYSKDILNIRNISERIGKEFGNQDRFVVPFSMLYVISPSFLERKKFFVLLPIGLSIPLVLLSQTRVALIILLISMLIYLKRLCAKYSKTYLFIIVLAIIITLATILIFVPTNISIFERFRNMFIALLTGSGDDSSMERIMLIRRSYVFGITHFFSGYGFDGILSYTSQASHDVFGDIAFSYGGLFAFIYLSFFAFLFVEAFKRKNGSELVSFLLGYFLVYFISGVFLSSRIVSVFFGVCFAFFVDRDKTVPMKPKRTVPNSYYEICV